MDTLLAVCLGIALAAASGLRIFLPLFLLSLAGRFGWVEVSGGFAWLTETPALIAFGIAVAIEVAAYSVPWLDNFLDAASAPLAIAAGVLISASTFTGMDPLPRWILAAVAGGGAAAGMHALTAGLRMVSTFATGGLGNFVIAIGELALSALLSILAFAIPLAAGFVAILILLVAGLRVLWRRSRRRALSPASQGVLDRP